MPAVAPWHDVAQRGTTWHNRSKAGDAVSTHKPCTAHPRRCKTAKDWLASGGAIPNDPALKQELATPIYWFDSAGRKVLESKDEIKKRLLGAGSPDIADALALTFAAPVAPRLSLEEEILSRHQIHQQPEYDLFADL